MPDENEIAALEERLKAAMLSSNVAVLESMLADDLIFTDHQGRVVSKGEDLATHRLGLLKLGQLDFCEQQIRLFKHFAVVAVRTELAGNYDGVPFSGRFAYTRVWQRHLGGWQVVAAHCSALAN